MHGTNVLFGQIAVVFGIVIAGVWGATPPPPPPPAKLSSLPMTTVSFPACGGWPRPPRAEALRRFCKSSTRATRRWSMLCLAASW